MWNANGRESYLRATNVFAMISPINCVQLLWHIRWRKVWKLNRIQAQAQGQHQRDVVLWPLRRRFESLFCKMVHFSYSVPSSCQLRGTWSKPDSAKQSLAWISLLYFGRRWKYHLFGLWTITLRFGERKLVLQQWNDDIAWTVDNIAKDGLEANCHFEAHWTHGNDSVLLTANVVGYMTQVVRYIATEQSISQISCWHMHKFKSKSVAIVETIYIETDQKKSEVEESFCDFAFLDLGIEFPQILSRFDDVQTPNIANTVGHDDPCV